LKSSIPRLIWFLAAISLVGIGSGLIQRTAIAYSATVSGFIVDADGPIPGASVRVRATENQTFSDSNGAFSLGGLNPGELVEVTAWADGYYIASHQVAPPASGVTFTLRLYHTSDHPDYAWTSPLGGSSENACGNCHPMIYPQWDSNAHGQAVSNPRFFSLYNGTDIDGAVQIGPGYLNDFPGTAGNCANCHAPGAAVDGYLMTNMNTIRDNVTAGIHCDFCHKVGGVYLNPASGTVHPNAPGVRSQKVLRPPAGDNIFFGPYDDIPDPDTYLPVITQSQYCAPCHQFSFWGTPIYESYNEWLDSAYAAQGITCQDCHMPPTGAEFFALEEVGGLPHPPESIPSHLQLGAASTPLLQDTVSMTVTTEQKLDKLYVKVEITNTGAGHHVPTDHPGRHLILTIEPEDEHGQPLAQLSGPRVPDWGGLQASLPGTSYAKVLQDAISGQFPVVSYWKQTLIINDNRIPAGSSSVSVYVFAVPFGENSITIKSELLFRRLFQEVIDDKGWVTPDVIMDQITSVVDVEPWWLTYMPLIQ
jgi:nitrate/TMAO reductase-like tetraheme cytochrome c subunit